jgi:hypothetical protein
MAKPRSLNSYSKLRSQCSFSAVGQAKCSTIANSHDPMQLKNSVGQGDTKRTREMIPTLAPIKTAFGKWLALDQTDLDSERAKPSGARGGDLVATPFVAQILVRAKSPRNRNAESPS